MQNGGYARRRRGEVSAHGSVNHRPKADYLALPGSRQLHILHVIPAVYRGLKVFRAGFGPLNRAAQLHGAKNGDHLVGIEGGLAAETAAYFWRDDANLMLAQARDQRGQKPGDVRVLATAPESQLPHGRQPGSNRRARLHRVGNQLLLPYGVAHHHFGGGEGGIHIAPGRHPMEGLVIRGLLVNLGRSGLEGRFRVNHGGQWLVINRD